MLEMDISGKKIMFIDEIQIKTWFLINDKKIKKN